MVTPGNCDRNILPYLLACSSWTARIRFPSGWPFAPAKNVQVVPMIGRLMGPGRSDIVLIDCFVASLFTLDDKVLNDRRVLSSCLFLDRTLRPAEEAAREIIVFVLAT